MSILQKVESLLLNKEKGDHRNVGILLFLAVLVTSLQVGVGFGFKYAGRELLDQEIPVDTLFAGLTLLLGLFVPMAIDRHRSVMESFYSVARARDTLARYIKDEKDKRFLEENVNSWLFEKESPLATKEAIDMEEWARQEDYVQDALKELFDAIYHCNTTRKWNVEQTYPDLMLLTLFLYFAILFPFFQFDKTDGDYAFECIFTALFCNVIFLVARRDTLPFTKGSKEYKTLQNMEFKNPTLQTTSQTTSQAQPKTQAFFKLHIR